MLRTLARIALVVALCALGLSWFWVLGSHAERIGAAIAWVRAAGVLGMLAFALAEGVAAIFLVPMAIFSAAAGLLYGPVVGLAVAWCVNTLGMTTAFAVGRTFGRGAVAARLSRNPRLGAIDAAIGEEGFKIVALVRLTPLVPHNVLNYLFALTRVRARDYVVGSALGLLPTTAVTAYAGSIAPSVAAMLAGVRGGGNLGGPWAWGLRLGGLAVTLVALVVIGRTAQRALTRAMVRAAATTTAPGAPPPRG